MNLPSTITVLSLLALGVPSVASAAPRLLITDQLAGTVLEFTGGGDISGNVFASGLSRAGGMCVGPDNALYVAEFGSGEITIVTAGGDMSVQPAFADTLELPEIAFAPVGLWCNDSVVLLTDLQGAVVNVAVGGSDPFAWQLYATWTAETNPSPLDIAQTDTGNVFVSSAMGIYRADLGVAADTPAFATGHPFVSLEAFGDELLAGVNDGPRIYDVTAGGDLTAADPWATLPGTDSVFAMLEAGPQRFAASGTVIYDVTDGGDLTGATPFATGLSEGLLYQGMVHWVCGSDADCDDAVACNGAETCVSNTCVPADEPLACDDDDVCTADACDPSQGCVHEPIEGCCGADLDCTLDEVCDLDANECVPAYVPTTGGGGDSSSGGDATTGESGSGDDAGATGGGEGPGGGEASGTSDGGDTDGAAADGDGAGCSIPGRGGHALWLLGLGILGVRRRRVSPRAARLVRCGHGRPPLDS